MRVHAKPLIETDLRLFKRLEDAAALVPNRRYARALEESYNHWQVALGRRAWIRPTITSSSNFLLREAERLLTTITSELRILTPAMQRAAFLSLAPDHLEGAHHWYPDIAHAWHLTHHYALQAPEEAHLETNNTLLFQDWARAFRKFAEEQAYITECELPGLLTKGLEAGDWTPEQPIILWGFSQADPPTPAESKLFEQLRRRKRLSDWPAPPPVRTSKQPRIVEFEQPEDELRAIALWARGLLESAQSPISIGIAFPNLGGRRHQVERQLINTLYPEGEAGPDEPRVFDIAGGVPLTRISVCESALLLLNFFYRDVSINELERLLESPFLELPLRVSIADEVRRQLPTRIRAHDLLAGNQSAHAVALRRYAKSGRRRRHLSAWLHEFHKLLETVGWTHAQSLDSLTYQHAMQLVRLFKEVGQCSPYVQRMSAGDAVSELARAADERHHEVQRSGTPIRVLDIEALVHLRFTHLWIGGMRNAEWPASTNANPFVSRLSQRNADVPGITPESRLVRARFITESLRGVAAEVAFSHSRFDGDEQHRPSALLPDVPCAPPSFFIEPNRKALLHLSHPQLPQSPVAPELFVDESGPACEPSERRGNADLVKDQSNCPFRAFGRHRLMIGRSNDPTDLPDARAMGNAAHRALEIAYRELPSQASIANHPNLKRLANHSAQQAVLELISGSPSVLRAGIKRMLSDLIQAWLVCDQDRPAYDSLHTEQEIGLELAGMLLKLKLDRFDKDIDSGKWVITDYKSSPPSPTSLRSHAGLHEPQLLLYAEALRETKGGEPVSLAFGTVGEPSNARYLHCSADARFRKPAAGREEDAKVLAQAGETVRQLVAEYLSGHASATPRQRACDTCHLQSLCRIDSLKRS